MKGWITTLTTKENYYIKASEVVAVYHDFDDSTLGVYTHVALKNGVVLHTAMSVDGVIDLIKKALKEESK